MNICAFENGNECNALTVKHCNACPFRKTAEEFRTGRIKAANRVDNLPAPPSQTHNSQILWHNEGV